MKLKAFSKVLTVVACALMLCVLAPTLTVADQAQYIYDDLGRLAKVIDGQGEASLMTFHPLSRPQKTHFGIVEL